MTNATFGELKAAIEANGPIPTTLTLRYGGSKIVGTATISEAGNVRVTLANNANSVVVTPRTNFIIDADIPVRRTAATVLEEMGIGDVFQYRNRYGVTKTWVKSGDNRFTRVGDELPAVSYSVAGFPSENPSDVSPLPVLY